MLAAACSAPCTWAQTHPQRPIRLVAPYPPGGAAISARLLAPRRADDLGQQMGFKKSPQWHAIMGPPGMPRERVMRINTAAAKALSNPAIVARYREAGAQIIASTAEALAATLKSELARMSKRVRTLGVELE